MASVWFPTLVLVLLSLLCFTKVLAETIEAVPPIPPHHNPYDHHPAMAPIHPPRPSHHDRNHPPSPEPSRHHDHHGHPPNHPPMHPPSFPPEHPPSPLPSRHHDHHGHPPNHAPSFPPEHPPMPHGPVHPPSHSIPPPKPHPAGPVLPPAHPPGYRFPRSFVAVQGVVYCKSCNNSGKDTLVGATPLLGATVKLQCNNTKYPQNVQAKTDKNGYFFVQAPKSVTNYGAHKCKVFLVPAPTSPCGKPSNLHGGITGAILRPEKPYTANKLPFTLFSVGPLAYEPKCKH